MNNVMLDLETMGKGTDAAIIAIGAVAFDTGTGALGDRFYVLVDLQSAIDAGGVMDASTVLWWMRQGDAARAAFQEPGKPIKEALAEFSAWLEGLGPTDDMRVWGNGAAFDNTILASAYRRAGMVRPWRYWNDMCYRTIKALHPEVKIRRTGIHHNALHDAEDQAKHLLAIMATAQPERRLACVVAEEISDCIAKHEIHTGIKPTRIYLGHQELFALHQGALAHGSADPAHGVRREIGGIPIYEVKGDKPHMFCV